MQKSWKEADKVTSSLGHVKYGGLGRPMGGGVCETRSVGLEPRDRSAGALAMAARWEVLRAQREWDGPGQGPTQDGSSAY